MKEIFKKWFDGQIGKDNVERGQLTGDIAWEILKFSSGNNTFVFYSTMFIALTKGDIESLTPDQTLWLLENLPNEFSHFCKK